MGIALGLSRRKIQKLIRTGAPDATDTEVDADWATWERTWRGYLAGHPRWRLLRVRPPDNLEHAAVTAPSIPAAPQDTDPKAHWDTMKAKAQAELANLQLEEARGRLVDRQAAYTAVHEAMQLGLAALGDLPTTLAQALPIEAREVFRLSAKRIGQSRADALREDMKTMWRRHMPTLVRPE